MAAAGCIFTDKRFVLAGFQKKKEKMVLSGFGGMVEPTDENVVDAAIRETLEELFHLQEVPKDVIKYLMVNYIPRNQFKNGDYQVFVYDFLDLADWLHICKGFGLQSSLYDTMPSSLLNLIMNRKDVEGAEVGRLCLLPVNDTFEFCPHFQSDLRLLARL